MKITILIITVFLLQVSASTTAQITLNEKGISLQKALDLIHKQSGYNFIYSDNDLKGANLVTIKVNNQSAEKALQICFENQKLIYQIADKTVMIKKKTDQPATFLDKISNIIERLSESFIDIKGVVVDDNGTTLPGATIIVKGTTRRATTNTKGEFILKNISENSILEISFIGFEKQEISIKGKTKDLLIKLKSTISTLDEVVVTIDDGYQKIKPEQSTGSVSVISAKDYESRINTTNFLDGLQNKIPGLLINNDITFGGETLLQVRGISTINGNKAPLIVIDGFPTELSIESIDPNDIESITVLKDAAAATIYGVRASNGVIVIQRKKSKIGALKVNFRNTLSLTPKEDYDRYRWDKNGSVLNIENIKNSYINTSATAWATANSLSGYANQNAARLIMAHWRSSTDQITTEERDRQLNELSSYYNANDYSRLFLRTAALQTYNLSISGGNDKILYYLSSNYQNNATNQIKTGGSSVMLSGRVNMKFSNRFSLDLTTNFRSAKSNSVPIPDINKIYPWERFEDENGNALPIYQGSSSPVTYNNVLTSMGLLDNMYYPLNEINEVDITSRTTTNSTTANFTYTIGKGFSLQFGGVYQNNVSNGREYNSENSLKARQLVNRFTTGTPGAFVYNIPKGAILEQTGSNTDSYTLRAQLNYNKVIKKEHSFNFIAGSEIRDVLKTSNLSTTYGYNDQTLTFQPVNFLSNTIGFTPVYGRNNPTLIYNYAFSQGYNDNRYVSLYSNGLYSFKNKYSLSASIRIDQSNLFGTDPKYRFKPLWSIGSAWNIDKEKFIQNIDWIKTLKLRMAYGFNGNVAKNSLPQITATQAFNTLNSLLVPMLSLRSYANESLRWEQTRNFNIGVDTRIFKTIYANLDYYVKTSTDLLADNLIDASKGGTSATINDASVRNSGLELGLHADWINKRKFNWNTGIVISHNTSKVLEVYNKNLTPGTSSFYYSETYSSSYLKGYPIGTIFSFRYAGLDANGQMLIYDKDGNKKLLYTPDDGIDDVELSGTSIPKINIGLSNRIDIGNFYAYAMLNYYGGFIMRLPVPSLFNNAPLRVLEGAGNYWKQPGDEADPNMLPAANGDYYTLTSTDRYQVSGAYLTLGDVTLAYNFRDALKKVGIPGLELKFQTSNLYTVGFNRENYSLATRSYQKAYLTPTYSFALNINL